MFIIQCFLHIKADQVDAFAQACIANAKGSLAEPECKRFDVVQQLDDPTRFVLFEAYTSPEGFEFHKTQPHYLEWKETVEDMQAEPRHAIKYQSVHPDDAAWG